MNGPPSSSERAARPRSWQPGAASRRGRGPQKGYICTKCLRGGPEGLRGGGGRPASQAGREKAAAVLAAWVMETFLWGPRRETHIRLPASRTHGFSAGRPGPRAQPLHPGGASRPGRPGFASSRVRTSSCTQPLRKSVRPSASTQPCERAPLFRAPSQCPRGVASAAPALPPKAGERAPLSQILVARTSPLMVLLSPREDGVWLEPALQ